MVRANRRFVFLAVWHLMTGLGIRQFMEIGAGMPQSLNLNLHEYAGDGWSWVVVTDRAGAEVACSERRDSPSDADGIGPSAARSALAGRPGDVDSLDR